VPLKFYQAQDLEGKARGELWGVRVSFAEEVARRLDYPQPGKEAWAVKPTRRSGTKDAETILHAQLDAAEAIRDSFANGARTYELMWGPLGGPPIEVMRMMLEAQRLDIEELKKTLN
jgi:hypothetical protein